MNGSGRPDELCKKGVPIILQNSQESTCARVSFLIKLQAEVCNCEFCEISKNIFSYRTPPVAASVWNWFCLVLLALLIKFFIIRTVSRPFRSSIFYLDRFAILYSSDLFFSCLCFFQVLTFLSKVWQFFKLYFHFVLLDFRFLEKS